jgi:hypothetical protein
MAAMGRAARRNARAAALNLPSRSQSIKGCDLFVLCFCFRVPVEGTVTPKRGGVKLGPLKYFYSNLWAAIST